MKKILFLLGFMLIISIANAQRGGRGGGYHGGYAGSYHHCNSRPFIYGPRFYIGPMFYHQYHRVWIEGYWGADGFGNPIWIAGYWRVIY